MFRGDRWAAAVVIGLAIGGCMRIYPDPELPDIVLEWPAELECAEDGDRVVASLTAADPASALEVTAPCRDGSLRFADVARVRYQLAAKLEDGAGAELGSYDQEIDLRDGLSEKVFAYFGRDAGGNFQVTWTFDMGASCVSLSAATVVLEASIAGQAVAFFESPCELAVHVSAIELGGPYTLRAFALAFDTVVAVSPDSAPFMVTRQTISNVGTLTLSPCGAACPPLGP